MKTLRLAVSLAYGLGIVGHQFASVERVAALAALIYAGAVLIEGVMHYRTAR